MTLSAQKLREYLTLHGAHVESWPQNIRVQGRLALQRPEFVSLFREEQELERLLQAQVMEPARVNLASRIITASYTRKQLLEPVWRFSQVLSDINPAALAATLVLGFAIGFSTLATSGTGKDTLSQQAYSDDEGSIL